MRDQILSKLAQWHAVHPWRMLSISLLITIIMLGFAGKLTVTMQIADILPEDNPKVAQFNKIIDEFATATSMVVVVQGEEQDIKGFADELAPQMLKLRDSGQNEQHRKEISDREAKIDRLQERSGKENQITELHKEIEEYKELIDYQLYQRIDYKVSTEFIEDYGLMLVKSSDLENSRDMFSDPNLTGLITNLNNSMEAEYVGQEESISTREKEDGAVNFLDGIQNLLMYLQKTAEGQEISESEIQAVVDQLLFGEPYMLSYDKTALILNGIPTFTSLDRDLVMSCTIETQALVDELLEKHPDVQAGLAGVIAREHDEAVAAAEVAGNSTLIAMVVILVILIFSFRMWFAPVFALVNLIVGIIWASGLAYLLVGQLNRLTSIFSIILFGLGIDFSIHLISGFTEWRSQGDSIIDALNKTFKKSGKGIITGGLTTALAFLALLISQSRGMFEMGIVIGEGLLSVLLTTLIFLPALLVLNERRIDRKQAKHPQKILIRRDLSFKFLGTVAEWASRHYAISIFSAVVLSVILVFSAFQTKWDYDYRSMEPEGLTSIALLDTVMDKFDISMDYALVITDDIEESRELAELYRDLPTVAITDDISLFLPSPAEQAKRKSQVDDIRQKMETTSVRSNFTAEELVILEVEIERLGMNIMEMQDMSFIGGQDKVDEKCNMIVGDPDLPESGNLMTGLVESFQNDQRSVVTRLGRFQRSFAPSYQQAVVRMATTAPFTLSDLPTWILDRYANKSRDQFLITVYPSGNIFDGEFLNQFVSDVELISEKATGMGPLTVATLAIFGQDGRNAIMLTIAIVLILLLIDFKRPRIALMAFIPLFMGFCWMLGLMYLTKIPLNMMTVMGLPLIIGIGIDDGVHVIHRWLAEGKGQVRTIFASTGKAIFLTTLTTMLAFGSLMFSVFPAYGQFGGSLFLGVGACFLTTVVFLPGIIGFIERNQKN